MRTDEDILDEDISAVIANYRRQSFYYRLCHYLGGVYCIVKNNCWNRFFNKEEYQFYLIANQLLSQQRR